MDRDEARFESMADVDLLGALDVAWWRGVSTELMAGAPPTLETGLALLYHALAGLLATPLVGESRAVRARTGVTRAIGELECVGVREAPAPGSAVEGGGPLGWEDVRVVLRSAVAVLRDAVTVAVDPVPVAQAVVAVRGALAELG